MCEGREAGENMAYSGNSQQLAQLENRAQERLNRYEGHAREFESYSHGEGGLLKAVESQDQIYLLKVHSGSSVENGLWRQKIREKAPGGQYGWQGEGS